MPIKYYEAPGREGFAVLDEYGQSHINLTLLAAMNKVNPTAVQNLLQNVASTVRLYSAGTQEPECIYRNT